MSTLRTKYATLKLTNTNYQIATTDQHWIIESWLSIIKLQVQLAAYGAGASPALRNFQAFVSFGTYVRPSVRTCHWAPTGRIFVNLILENSIKICRDNPNVSKLRQKYLTLYVKTQGHCNKMNYVYFSNNTKKSSLLCIRENASIFSLLAATYRGNTALSIHGKSV